MKNKYNIIKDENKIKSNEIEQFNPYVKDDAGIVASKEISELQGSLIELNNDNFNEYTRMSGIDLRSRLYPIEITSILAIDTLTSFKFLPTSLIPLTLQKKRLAVSLNGKGREEIVNIVSGKREMDSAGTFTSRFASIFKPNQP